MWGSRQGFLPDLRKPEILCLVVPKQIQERSLLSGRQEDQREAIGNPKFNMPKSHLSLPSLLCPFPYCPRCHLDSFFISLPFSFPIFKMGNLVGHVPWVLRIKRDNAWNNARLTAREWGQPSPSSYGLVTTRCFHCCGFDGTHMQF